MKDGGRRAETVAIHAAGGPDAATGALAPPIHLSTTFERDVGGAFSRGYLYTRYDNPNRAALERLLASLEGGAAAVAFASGSAAAAALFRALLRPGDHAVLPQEMYYSIRRYLQQHLGSWGVRFSAVDMTDLQAVEAAVEGETRLVWVETPSNPLLRIVDVRAVCELAHHRGARVACDATYTPPPMQANLELGADMVVHATTKYLSGHSDVLGGVVVFREEDEASERVRYLQGAEGAVPSPFDCWLTVRGVKTLPYRVRGHSENAAAVARFLEAHPRVLSVHYPGLESHPGHAVAARQMRGFGGMLSFRIAGGEESAMRVSERLRLVTRATSFGAPESLIEHRASIEGPDSSTPRDLLRMSVGLEHRDDILADLEQALAS